MAALFTRAPNPIWFMNNLTGAALNDTYWAFFLTNTLPYLPQAVYQTQNGTPWSNPIEFQPSGGLPNNLFFDETLVYRIEIRQGPTQADPLIWLIENFVPGNSLNTETVPLLTSDNLITNPQFADVYFNSSVTLTTAGTYSIAPGWTLVLTGAGSTTLTQVANSGDTNFPGNPPYYLMVNSTGWSSVKLKQQFANNGAIFAGGAIAIALDAYATTASQVLSVDYVDSNGISQAILVNKALDVGAFQSIATAVNINTSTNPNLPPAAFVNIEYTLPPSAVVNLTNFQITGQSTNLPTNFDVSSAPVFQEISYERIVDHEFHVYRNSIIMQPKDSILTGWNFGLNPWQFTATTLANLGVNGYTADQTIVIQQQYVTSAAGNNIAVGQGSFVNNHALQIKAVTAHNQFAILQYIDPSTVLPYWGSNVSSLVKLFLSSNKVPSTTVRFKMRLIYHANLPNAVSQMDPIASWAEGSDPVPASGYTFIVPQYDPIYTMSTTPQDYAFNNMILPALNSTTDTLGILLYTIDNMNQAATADSIFIKDVSLVPNQFAIESNPKTWDQTLRECQFYFEKSWDTGTPIGTATNVGMRFQVAPLLNDGTTLVFAPKMLELVYKEVKRGIPAAIFYSNSTGTADTVRIHVFNGTNTPSASSGTPGTNPSDVTFSSYWNVQIPSTSNFIYQVATDTAWMNFTPISGTGSYQGTIYYHYTLDAKLGM